MHPAVRPTTTRAGSSRRHAASRICVLRDADLRDIVRRLGQLITPDQLDQTISGNDAIALK